MNFLIFYLICMILVGIFWYFNTTYKIKHNIPLHNKMNIFIDSIETYIFVIILQIIIAPISLIGIITWLIILMPIMFLTYKISQSVESKIKIKNNALKTFERYYEPKIRYDISSIIED